jgi:hypothetical protein
MQNLPRAHTDIILKIEVLKETGLAPQQPTNIGQI